jgi:hypothetical protein
MSIQHSFPSTRRDFLRNGAVFAVTAAVAPVTAFAGRLRLRDVSLDNISVAALADQLNTSFIVRDTVGRMIRVQLAAIEPADLSTSATDESYERFSLLFVGSISQPLLQNTYIFEHARIGRFEMFIVPVGRADATYRFYEAVFNRPTPNVISRAIGLVSAKSQSYG